MTHPQRAAAMAVFAILATAVSAQGYSPAMPETTTSPVVSSVPLSWPRPQPNPYYNLGNGHTGYPIFRGYAVADLNGDRLLDLVLCPSYYNFEPELPLVVLLNQGNGRFADGTAAAIEGTVPTCGSPNNIFARDLNGDGRPDLFIVEQGLEDKEANNPGMDGGVNRVLLSQPNGRLRDATDASLPGQPMRFNHVSSMGDINGDGAPDVVLASLGGVRLPAGLVVLMNDGSGRFTDRRDLLPAEAVERTSLRQDLDQLNPGATGLGDLDGDGRLDLVAASYAGGDYPSTRRTVRIYRQGENGAFAERARLEIPAALASIPYVQGGTVSQGRGGLGASGIYIADFNADGRNDLVVLWEGAGTTYFQMLRNDGNFAFTEVTEAWWGGSQAHVVSEGSAAGAMMLEVRDLNGDGVADIFVRRGYIDAGNLNPSSLIYLNDGSGRFTPWRWQSGGVQATAQVLRASMSPVGPFSFLHFDVDGDGFDDPVYLRYLHDFSVTPSFSRGFELRTYRSAPPVRAGTSVKDLWWAGEAENGWGMSITQHRDTLFAVFYVYDAQGQPVWYVMPGGTWNAARTAYTGSLYAPRGAAFSGYDASRFEVGAAVGAATLTFTGNSTASVAFTINGVSGTKQIVRQRFATGASSARYDDLWWGGAGENGWGVNIAQQGEVLFAVWYTYDAAGAARWYVMSGGNWSGTRYTGTLYSTRSSPWLGAAYLARSFVPTAVGEMSLTFLDTSSALFTYSVNGVRQTKPIARQPF